MVSLDLMCDDAGSGELPHNGLLGKWLDVGSVGTIINGLFQQHRGAEGASSVAPFAPFDGGNTAARPTISSDEAPSVRGEEAAPQQACCSSPSSSNSSTVSTSCRKQLSLDLDGADDCDSSHPATPTAPCSPDETLAIPRFWFEGGSRGSPRAGLEQRRIRDIEETFAAHPDGLSLAELTPLTSTLCGFPSYLNALLFARMTVNTSMSEADSAPADAPRVTLDAFLSYWRAEVAPFDSAERLFRLLAARPRARTLTREDLEPVVAALLACHPALAFLRKHPQFQARYAQTSVARMFYALNTSRTGRITLRELRRSSLVGALSAVDLDKPDINQETDFFSYEAFYVIYCRFYELDIDQDGRLRREDLLRYGNHALSAAIVDRIFEVGARPFEPESGAAEHPLRREFMLYEDFVYFMLSAENPSSECALRYWFACVDVSGSGRIGPLEMRYFYSEQMRRVEIHGYAHVPFADMLCQMWDLLQLRPDCAHITMADLLRHADAVSSAGDGDSDGGGGSSGGSGNGGGSAGVLFDCLFNLHRFVAFERRDHFFERERRLDGFRNDWERFASRDYQLLASQAED
eukprot:TRINITY_DN1203_c3_g2_i1.p1 TRINITY_DN1203_c3_g2~~TRINITY_DN1203_c3_g2_i1.p1  ORF type:complete len:578 (-),score=149.37 TRINITY_DN1203_c3_g2_i1:471-2204(-)